MPEEAGESYGRLKNCRAKLIRKTLKKFNKTVEYIKIRFSIGRFQFCVNTVYIVCDL